MFTEKFITLKQRIFENPNVNVIALCKSCVKIALCSSELIFQVLYASRGIRNSSEHFVSCIHLCFVNFALHPNPHTQKKNLTDFGQEIQTAVFLSTFRIGHLSYKLFSSQSLLLSPPKTLTFLLNHPVYSKAIFFP
jgi:hypothetical protein